METKINRHLIKTPDKYERQSAHRSAENEVRDKIKIFTDFRLRYFWTFEDNFYFTMVCTFLP